MKKHLLILFLLILCTIFLMACGDDDHDNDRDEKEDSPSISENIFLGGSYTITDYLNLSKRTSLIFYWLREDLPTKSSEIESIYVFNEGKVYIFNNMDILEEAWGRNMTLGDMLRCDDSEIIAKLWSAYEEQVNNVVKMIIHDKLSGASLEMFTGNEPQLLVPVSEPVASECYFSMIYTDESGNSLEHEILLFADPWGNNVVKSGVGDNKFWSINREDGDVTGALYRRTGMGDEANQLTVPIALSQEIQGEIHEASYVGFRSERIEIPRGTTEEGCFITKQMNGVVLTVDEIDDSFAVVDPTYDEVEFIISDFWYQTDVSDLYFEELDDKDVEHIPTPTQSPTSTPIPTNTPTVTPIPATPTPTTNPKNFLTADFDGKSSGLLIDASVSPNYDPRNTKLFFDSMGNGLAGFAEGRGVDGSNCMSCTGREAVWHGISLDIPANMYGKKLDISFDAYIEGENDNSVFSLSSTFKIKSKEGTITTLYPQYNRVYSTVESSKWVHFEGSICFPSDIYSNPTDGDAACKIYFESSETNGNFYIDNIIMTIGGNCGDYASLKGTIG